MTAADYETITDLDRLREYVRAALNEGRWAFDTETTSVNAMTAELVGFSMSVYPGEAAYVPLFHVDDSASQIHIDDALEILRDALECPVLATIGQNIKYDGLIMSRYGVEIAQPHDVMLMSYALHGGEHNHGMDELARRYLNHTTIKFREVAGSGANQVTFDQVPIEDATAYAAEDADVTLRLANIFWPELCESSVSHIYEVLDLPLVHVIVPMERTGILVDRDYLQSLDVRFESEINNRLDTLKDIAGADFNPASPDQVGKVLNTLGAPLTKLTQTGKIATGEDVLSGLQNDDTLSPDARALVDNILDFRKFAKLRGTYTQGLIDSIHSSTGRVHTSFGLASTTTGRLASSDPNLQNIPIRTEEGRLLRKAFIGEDGHKLVAADYSQIELRVVALAAGDEALLQAFEDGADIHAITAASVWGGDPLNMDPVQRRRAKAVNFGIIYGISAFGLSRQIDVPEGEAQDIIDSYLDSFPGVRAYMENAVAFARRNGYVETIGGRQIHTPSINHANRGRRSYAERATINAPIQGTAADVIKAAMLNSSDYIRDNYGDVRMLLQVHDELLFEVPDSQVEEFTADIRTVMEASAPYLDVALQVDAKSGHDWEEAH